MTKIVIDGILKDWGDRLFYPPLKGRKGRNVRGGSRKRLAQLVPKLSGTTMREVLARTAKKTPEVMVKISGGGKNMQHIKAHMDYISRNGEVEVEDENGDCHHGKAAMRDVRDSWAKGKIGIPYDGEKRREAFNIILSMPPGTDRQAVKDAARAFAKGQFSRHQYIFSAHEDERHPHVHLAVKAVDHDGVRMNPRKGDLQRWREQFAEKLREHGVAANATPRRSRGVVQKPEKQAIKHINKEFEAGKRKAPARVAQAQHEDARIEATTGKQRVLRTWHNPQHVRDKVTAVREMVSKAYGQIARALATGDADDRELALDIVQLVRAMPAPIIKHDANVQRLKKAGRKTAGKNVERKDAKVADKIPTQLESKSRTHKTR
jgi:hypothetical protein